MLTHRYRPSAIRIPLPAVQQHTDFTCGPACLHSIAAYYGKASKDHSVTAQLCRTDREGTKPKALLRAARKLGLRASIVEPMSDEQLRMNMDRYRPVILNLQAHGDGHYVAACGYDRTCLYFMEPHGADGHYGFVRWRELAARWWDIDDGDRNDRLGLVIAARSAQTCVAVWSVA